GSGSTNGDGRAVRSVRRPATRALFATAVRPLARVDPFGLAAGRAGRAATRPFAFNEATATLARPPFALPLADGFRILPAPAALLRRRCMLIEHFADLLHEIFGQTRLGDEGVTAGFLRAFGNAGERVSGQRDHRNVLGAF